MTRPFFSLLLATLAATPALAQDSRPADKPVKFEGQLVYTVMDESRKPTVMLYDGAVGKAKVLQAGSMCLGVSPAGKTFCSWTKKGSGDLEFRSVKSPETVVASLPKTFAWPAFLNEDTVFLPNYKPKGDENVKFELLRLSLKSGERVSVAAFPDTSWDDIPIRLTPDGKKLTFFLRGKVRGLQVLDLESGKSSPLPGVTMLNWAPDSSHCAVWSKKEKGMSLRKLEGGALSIVEPFPQGAILGVWVSKDAMVYAKMDVKAAGGGALVYRDMKTQKEVTCTQTYGIDSMGLLTLATTLPQGRFAFVEQDEVSKASRLVLAKVEGGKVSKQTLVTHSGGRVGMIFGR
jgi:hypothetical protein